jgi:hypothetical protein
MSGVIYENTLVNVADIRPGDVIAIDSPNDVALVIGMFKNDRWNVFFTIIVLYLRGGGLIKHEFPWDRGIRRVMKACNDGM